MMHFPNLSKTTITLIDANIKQTFDIFKSHFPGYESIYNIEFNLIENSIFSDEARTHLKNILKDENVIPYIIICLNDSDQGLAAGLNLPLEVYKKQIPVLIRYNTYQGISGFLGNDQLTKINQNQFYQSIRFWGMNDLLFFDENGLELREQFAESAH